MVNTVTEYTSHTNPIGNRLKSEMKKQGFTSTELARRADVLTSFLYDIISGKSSNPSTVKLARVADALGISLTYLVNGSEANLYNIANNDYVGIRYVTLSDYAKNGDGKNISHKQEIEPHYFSREWIKNNLNADIDDLRILIIDGDSMSPALCHKDIVLIDTKKKTPSPPSIFILFDGFGLTAKRLEYVSEPKNPHVRVISDNQHYSTYECSISDVTIIGRVVWFSRKM